MSYKKQHVIPHSSGWAVKGEGNQKVTSIHRTQRDAINAARDIARNQGSEMFIHNGQWRIRERNTYGNDPFPPKG